MSRLAACVVATGVALIEGLGAAGADAAGPAPMKLQKTYVDAGTMGGQGLPSGTYQPVGSKVTFTCTNAAGCMVLATLELQIKQAGVNAPALCFYVDGASVTCPTNDQLSATTGFKVMVHHSSTLLPLRDTPAYTLEMRVYSEVPTQMYRYQAEYRVFK